MLGSVAGKISLMMLFQNVSLKEDIRVIIYYHTPNSLSFVNLLGGFNYYIITE